MNKFYKCIPTVILLSFSFIKSQDVGFGIGVQFTPWDLNTSTTTIKLEDEFIEGIIKYFYPETCQQNVQTTENKYLVDISSCTKYNIEQIKKLSLKGFGRLDIIRLLLIYEQVKNELETIKPLIELSDKGKTLKEIAEKYNVNYREVWLKSKEIFNEIKTKKLW